MSRFIAIGCQIPACEWTMSVDQDNINWVATSYHAYMMHHIVQHPEILMTMIELTSAPAT